jgi:hypothetical protein
MQVLYRNFSKYKCARCGFLEDASAPMKCPFCPDVLMSPIEALKKTKKIEVVPSNQLLLFGGYEHVS